ncbi:response regulator [Bdellovibrio sp. NC01]|nr:response regulator [Bdellovibrio sp. NC01]
MVDDERDVGLLSELNFRSAISTGKIHFHYFEDPLKCLQYLEKHDGGSDTLVLTDINMPELTGFDLLENIRDKHPNVLVFMMSAYDDNDCIEKAMRLGATGYFTKPVSYKKVKSRITEEFGIAI